MSSATVSFNKTMDLSITCDPPLSFVSVLDTPKVLFTVGVNSSVVKAEKNWEFSIWHNNRSDGVWTHLPLRQLQIHCNNEGRVYFRGCSPRASEVTNFQFTLRFRSRSGTWQWARDLYGLEDGDVIFQSRQILSDGLSYYLSDLTQEFSLQGAAIQRQSCYCWELTTNVPAAQGRVSGRAHTILGRPLQSIRWFAIVRHNEPWFSPRQGRVPIVLDKEGILLSFLRTDGLHLVIVALSGIDDVVSTFMTGEDGQIAVLSRNDRSTKGTARLFIAVGPTCHVAVEAAFGAIKGFVQFHIHNAESKSDTWSQQRQPSADEEHRLSDWFDGFTYCTWNGLGQTLAPAKICDALNTLTTKGIHITNLIIDDNWQSLDYSGHNNFYHRWTSFEANREHFPSGLKDLISKIRTEHPRVQNIAVWHGIFGYWGGISPRGDIARKYSMRTFERRKGIFLGGGDLTTVDGPDIGKLFDDFYRFLADAGVNAVKTDTQSFLDYPEHADDRRSLAIPYQDALHSASMKYFQGKSIACMAQIPQVIFYSMMRNDMPRIIMRNSEDFLPDDASSHAWHVFCNAHNALLMQHLNILPDWDMFQTDHDFSTFHAAARCVSGGPIYITDIPGKHCVSLVDQITAKTPDGRCIILRPEQVGRTSEIYVAQSEARLLNIQTWHMGASILGVFNVGSATLTEFVHLDHFLDISNTTLYIIRHFSSGKLVGPWKQQDDFPMVELTVGEHAFEILTAYPVRTFGKIQIAVLGLLGKMSGAAAITDLLYHTQPLSSEVKIEVSLKALGSLGFYVSDPNLPSRGITLIAHRKPVPNPEKFLSLDDSVLLLDLNCLWEDLGLMPCRREDAAIDIVFTISTL